MAKVSGTNRKANGGGWKSLVERFNETSKVKYSVFEERLPTIRRMLHAMPNGTLFTLEGQNSNYKKDGNYINEESRVRTLGTMAVSPLGGGYYQKKETTRYNIDSDDLIWLHYNKIKLKK